MTWKLYLHTSDKIKAILEHLSFDNDQLVLIRITNKKV